MSDKTGRHSRILVIALAAITMGGVAAGFARHAPDAVAAPSAAPVVAEAAAPHAHTVTLYKSPTCTCWIRDDLRRLPEMSAQELESFMPEHRQRVVRLLDMHETMMRDMGM